MSRREIVVLVSRAIALLQIIVALNASFVNLPINVFLLFQRMELSHVGLFPIELAGII